MKLALTARQRATLLFLSGAGYVAWFSGLGEPIEAQGVGPSGPATFTIVEPGRAPQVADVIRRNPFAGKPSDDAAPRAAAAPPSDTDAGRDAAGSGVDPAVAIANTTGGLAVPNIGAAPAIVAQASSATLTLALRATIVGPNPVAYVENGTVMDIVRVGDSLGDRRIAKIDLRGIAFADGTRLDLPQTEFFPPAQPAVGAPPARVRQPRALTLDDLRRLLAPRAKAQTAQPAQQATPSPAAAENYPSPGPLPSVDARGLPVGVNPTPNPNAPTPFPYPYPYAPPIQSQ